MELSATTFALNLRRHLTGCDEIMLGVLSAKGCVRSVAALEVGRRLRALDGALRLDRSGAARSVQARCLCRDLLKLGLDEFVGLPVGRSSACQRRHWHQG